MMLSNVKYQMEMKSKNGEQKCLLITNRADEDEQYSIMQPINTSTNNTSSLLLEKNSQKNGQRKKSISSNGKIGGKFSKNSKSSKRTDSLLTDEMELDNLPNEEGIIIIDSSDDEDNLLSNFGAVNNFKKLGEEENGSNREKEGGGGYILNLKIKISQRLRRLNSLRKPFICCCLPFCRTAVDNVEFRQFY